MRAYERALSDMCDEGGIWKTYNAGDTDCLGATTRCRPHMSDLTEELSDQEDSATRGDPTITKPQTVFYVDDNPTALRVLTSVLEGCGYKMVIACNTGEALERMERNAFGLVLLTYRLPRMISFKLAREIKRFSPGTPIILVSGHTLVAPEELTYVDAYVGKGATLDSLLTQMRLLIGRT